MGRVLRALLRLAIVAWLASLAVALVAALRLRASAPPRSEPSSDELALVAAFDRLEFASNARSLRGGRVVCAFGGGDIDLRGATPDLAGVRLDVLVIFGGGQILVPDGWRVTARVIGIGGVGDARPRVARAPDAPELVVEGIAFFGGFGIASKAGGETAPAGSVGA